jgi:formate-dependent phosphoribosylglycinamide formyltransferase (GAR transformylase)
VGARVIGIGERPKEYLDDEMRNWLTHYEQVNNVTSVEQVERAVRFVQSKVRIDRLEASVEAHVMCAAKVREACGIPGTSVETTFLCRDKPSMKEVLRTAGVPCAQSIGSGDVDEIKQFAERVGYPLIVKPRDAAGAAATYRCDHDAQLDHALRESGVGHGRSVAVEEFIEGHEGFWDTITIGGTVVHEFVCHYYPTVLEAMRNRSVNPQFICTNRIDAVPAYDEVKAMGRKVVTALGIDTSATHMEWFFGPKGLKFSEIACRPPGVGAWDLYCAANDMDIYREWAEAVVWHARKQTPSRRFSAGIIALRPDRDGRIAGYEGVNQIERAFGQWIIDAHFPPPGSPTGPVEAGFMANAWLRMKHPDYDELRRMLDLAGETIKVRAA